MALLISIALGLGLLLVLGFALSGPGLQAFAMVTPLAITAVPAALAAAAVAAIINLPTVLPIKLLALAAMGWGIWINHHLATIRNALGEVAYWSRFSCVALQIRNEHDKLPSPHSGMDQLLQMDKREMAITRMMTVGGFALFAIFLAVALDRGWFGPVGYNWTADVSGYVKTAEAPSSAAKVSADDWVNVPSTTDAQKPEAVPAFDPTKPYTVEPAPAKPSN